MGIVLLNLGELHLELCEYQNAYESLTESQKILSELKSKEELHTLFLFAKFWYEVGNTSELQKTINKFEKLLDILPNVEKYNFITLRFIQLFLIKSENTKLESAEIQKLLSEVEKENVENLYIDLIFILVDALINEKKLDYAINLLNDSKFETQIEGMNYYEAKRLYYLGILAKEQDSKILGSSIDYFEQSFKLLENDNISELTWKVLMEIAIIYWERGNSFKSKKPRAYAEELLSMIYEHIRINKVRKFYLNKLERKNAQLILKKISDNEKVYEFQKN